MQNRGTRGVLNIERYGQRLTHKDVYERGKLLLMGSWYLLTTMSYLVVDLDPSKNKKYTYKLVKWEDINQTEKVQ